MKKVIFTLLLCILLPLQTFASFEVDGLLYDVTSVENLEAEVIGLVDKNQTTVVIPDCININGKTLKVTSIGDKVFCNTVMSEVKIGENVRMIGEMAFSETNIRKIVIPPSVIEIGKNCFYKCSKLKELILNDGELLLNCINKNVFKQCPLEYAYIGRTFLSSALVGPILDTANLSCLQFGPQVKLIPLMAFWGAKKLESVVIPGNVDEIFDDAFGSCPSLRTIKLEYGADPLELDISWIDPNSLYSKSSCVSLNVDRRIAFPPNSKRTPAFYDLNIEEYIIGENIRILPGLSGCKEIQTIEIPANIEKISGGFASCPMINTIVCNAINPPQIINEFESGAFDNNVYASARLIVPAEAIEAYKTADVWKNFFLIEASDIDEIEYDKNVKVYSLQGVRMNISSMEEVKTLAPGIYIVNGRKIRI